MDEREEHAYTEGQRRAWMKLLSMALNELGEEETQKHAWKLERQAAIAALRSLCSEFGDNEWPDDLHLGDVISKHLGDHLRAR